VFGIRLPSRVGHGSFDAELRETVSSDEMLACALVPLLDARTVLYKTYLKLDNAVKGLVRVDPICRRLMSIPGVGPVTSLTFRAAVDDPSRFKSSRTVAAHFGLTPRRFQSGELDNPGTYLQSRRCRRSLGTLCRGPLASDPQRPVVNVEGLGRASRQDTWPPPRGHCRGPQDGGDPASHVD
jgi:transposase